VTADLDRDVRAGEEEGVRSEGLRDRYGQQEAREHEPDEQQPDGGRLRIELVRDPRRVVPGPPHDEEHDRGLPHAGPGQVREQQVRDLRDREDEHEVVEQLERRRALLPADLAAALEAARHRQTT
jgi:hypothetical protein